jgi:hypothetical protein
MTTELNLERRDQPDETPVIGGAIMMTPAIDEDYWMYRVVLGEHQAIVGFPKFGTIGIGFAVEEDWNLNLPYTCGTDEIFQHIRRNKGDTRITDADVKRAITLIQVAATADRGQSW